MGSDNHIATSKEQQAKLLDLVFEHSLDGIVLLDKDYNFVRVSETYARSCQRDVSELLGRNHFDLYPSPLKDDFDKVKKTKCTYQCTERPFTFPDHPDRGTTYWDLGLVPIFDDDGEIEFFLFTLKDVTERKSKQLELQRSEGRFRSITDNATDLIFIKDKARRYTFANRAMQELLGLPEKDILGKTADEFFEPEQSIIIRQADDRTFAGENVNETHKLVIADKKSVFNVNQSPLTIDDGKVTSILEIARDITAQKQAEENQSALREQLARVERMESLGVLTCGVAHDLNNVLGPMVILPELIQEDIDDYMTEDSPARALIAESLKIVKTSAVRAAVVVRDLMALTKRGQYERTLCDINKLPYLRSNASCINSLKANYPQITIEHTTAKESLIVLAASDHLNRAVDNLIRNAAEAIDEKGLVQVTTSIKHLDIERMGYTIVPPGTYAVIEVSDNGGGINPEHLSKIFEPFFSKKLQSERSGSGLGLSVVHGVVSDHDGFIDVTTKVGEGSTFSIYLPVITDATIQETKEQEEEPSRGTEHILIVDDEPGQRFLLQKSLQKLGYTVDEAENGHAALALFKELIKKGEPSSFDLVLLDMVMGDAFDGLATLQKIVKLYPAQKVIIVSGHAEDDRTKESLNLGANWLTKPYDINEFAKAIREKLDS